MGRHRTQEQWRELLRQQAASGLSIPVWCRKHSLGESAFYRWRERFAGQSGEDGPSAFVAVQVRPDEPRGCIEIVLAGGRQIRLTGPVDRQGLAQVLAVLEGAAC